MAAKQPLDGLIKGALVSRFMVDLLQYIHTTNFGSQWIFLKYVHTYLQNRVE